jgi:hypothetical protein
LAILLALVTTPCATHIAVAVEADAMSAMRPMSQ